MNVFAISMRNNCSIDHGNFNGKELFSNPNETIGIFSTQEKAIKAVYDYYKGKHSIDTIKKILVDNKESKDLFMWFDLIEWEVI